MFEKLVRKDKYGNYAACGSDGKISVYNKYGEAVNKKETISWLRRHGYNVMQKQGKIYLDVAELKIGTAWTGKW